MSRLFQITLVNSLSRCPFFYVTDHYFYLLCRNAHVSVFDPTKHIAQPVPRSQDPTQNVLTFYIDVEIDGESGALDEESTLAAIQVS